MFKVSDLTTDLTSRCSWSPTSCPSWFAWTPPWAPGDSPSRPPAPPSSAQSEASTPHSHHGHLLRQARTKLLYVNVNKTNSSNLIIMESLNLKGANFQFWIDNFYVSNFFKILTMIGEWLYMKIKYSIYFDIHVHVVQFICKYRLRVSWKYNRSWSSF